MRIATIPFRTIFVIAIAWGLVVEGLCDPAPQAAYAKLLLTQEVQLTGDEVWVDTGIDVHPGERIVVNAKGTLHYADVGKDAGPEGLVRGFKDLLRILPLNSAGRGALLGRIGDAATAQPFLIGTKCDVVAPIAGKLSLDINQTNGDSATGTLVATVQIYAADAKSVIATAHEVERMHGVDAALFAKLPRRVGDKSGNAGDMVNFLILAPETAMQHVFTAAGWVKVDPDVRETVLHGLIESLSKGSYLTMPMSQLYLFGRPQDYGWAHAEPIAVVASRNHLRLWKAGFVVDGTTLWAGAATHDTGFERDARNGEVTHKIDSEVDLEREFVRQTLVSTGLVSELAYFLPKNPVQEAKTATGGSFHSDGKVLVLKLSTQAQYSSADSAKQLH